MVGEAACIHVAVIWVFKKVLLHPSGAVEVRRVGGVPLLLSLLSGKWEWSSDNAEAVVAVCTLLTQVLPQ